MADLVGQQLGNYRLIRLLGEGGFAEVYLGEHIHLGTQAAIKVLHTQLTIEDVDHFRNEARTIARLVHPHIVRVFDFGVEGKTPFLVMDYAPNGTLRQRHPRGMQVPLPTVVSYVKEVAEALQYAHDERLIHRDIKPENMLIGRRNEILLSDFGIALVAQSSRYQSTQEAVGTIAYMAPEQIQGKPRPASDQYALGVVVYEWLSGSRPFQGSFTEIVAQHVQASPPSLREKVPTIPQDVEQVVLMALAKDPHMRFMSMRAFANALEQASLSERPSPYASTFVRPPSIAPPQSPPSDMTPPIPAPLNTPTIASEPLTPATPLPLPSSPVTTMTSTTLTQPKRPFSRRLLLAGLAGLALAGGGIAWLELSQRQLTSPPVDVNPADPTVDSVYCDVGEQTAFHIHVHVSLYIDGQPTPISAQVGIPTDGSCLYWLHTHDTTGVIHVESPTQRTYTFGQFLDLWGTQFVQLNYPNQLNQSDGWTAYVNGKLYKGNFRNIPLNAHTLITLGYNSPGMKPDTTYNWGNL